MIVVLCILSIVISTTVQSIPVNDGKAEDNLVQPSVQTLKASDFVGFNGFESRQNQPDDLKTAEFFHPNYGIHYPGYGGYPTYGKPHWGYWQGWYGWRPHYGIHGGYWNSPGFWNGRYYG